MMEWSRVREGGLKQFQGVWGGGEEKEKPHIICELVSVFQYFM